MQIRLHKNATTTPAQRAFIQNNPHLSTADLAQRTGVSKTTVRRWRNRSDIYDRPHTPKRIKTALSPVDEVAVILCRMATRSGLDDLHRIVNSFMEIHCSRASLNRCLKRYHISRSPSLSRLVPFDLKDYTGTYFYYNCFHLPGLTGSGAPVLFHTLLDCTFRFFYAGSSLSGPDFLEQHILNFPLKVLGIIHEDPVVLTREDNQGGKRSHAQMVETSCHAQNLVSYRLDTRWSQTLQSLKQACCSLEEAPDNLSWNLPWPTDTELSAYIRQYNTRFTLRALRQKTPRQVMEDHYIEFPNSFRQKPPRAVPVCQ